MKIRIASICAALALHATPALADAGGTASGVLGDWTWSAKSTIVGKTSTATIASGGDKTYVAPQPAKSGVVALIMTYASGNAFICSGSLLSGGTSILTAGHCASDGTGARPVSTTAYFYGGSDPDTVVPGSPAVTAVTVGDILVNPLYTGQVIDQNDVAVYKLSNAAPAFATSYGLYQGKDLTGQNFTVDGYGQRSDAGGAIGADLGPGRLREGENRFDFRWGDPQFDGFFNGFFGSADASYSYLSDFDNGLSVNDASCTLGGAFGLATSQFCDTGLGSREASIAGGDSGGPEFIDGQIAAVSSYTLVLGNRNLGADYLAGLNSSWGEFNGFAPVAQNLSFIQAAVALPEPATWLMIIIGFGAIGFKSRRRQGLTRPVR